METLTKILHPKASERVAVVTGAEKGIGYAVVKQILELEPHWTVYLTAKDPAKGENAYRKLKEELKDPVLFYFAQLDIEDINSIRQFHDHVKKHHSKGIYLLVNNAGKFKNVQAVTEAAAATPETACKFMFDRTAVETVIRNNFFGTMNVCDELFPLLSEDARVINLSSRMAQMAFVNSTTEAQQKFANCTKISDVKNLMETFLATDPDSYYTTAGWMAKPPETQLTPRYTLGAIYPYGISKLAINLVTQIYQRQFDAEKKSKNILVNAVCPGVMKVESTEPGLMTSDEGADSVTYAAMLPKDSMIRGQFLADRKVLDHFVIPDEALYR